MILLSAVLLLPILAFPARKSENLNLIWSGKKVLLDKVPENFPQPILQCIRQFQSYAAEHDLSVLGEPEMPVLFFASQMGEIKKIAKRVKSFDEQFRTKLSAERSQLPPIPVFVLDKIASYAPLIDLLVKDHEYLTSWAGTAKNLSGFQLFEPPICVVLLDGPGREEFNLSNQVIHQLGHLYAGLEFGALPFWLTEALAWEFEDQAHGNIYAFCYRSGFVSVTEHEGWLRTLQNLYKKKKAASMAQVVELQKKNYNPEAGLVGFGFVFYFLKENPQGLQKFMRAYAAEHQEKFGKEPERELEPARQLALLQESLGKDFEEKLTEHFLKGKIQRK